MQYIYKQLILLGRQVFRTYKALVRGPQTTERGPLTPLPLNAGSELVTYNI